MSSYVEPYPRKLLKSNRLFAQNTISTLVGSFS